MEQMSVVCCVPLVLVSVPVKLLVGNVFFVFLTKQTGLFSEKLDNMFIASAKMCRGYYTRSIL